MRREGSYSCAAPAVSAPLWEAERGGLRWWFRRHGETVGTSGRQAQIELSVHRGDRLGEKQRENREVGNALARDPDRGVARPCPATEPESAAAERRPRG